METARLGALLRAARREWPDEGWMPEELAEALDDLAIEDLMEELEALTARGQLERAPAHFGAHGRPPMGYRWKTGWGGKA